MFFLFEEGFLLFRENNNSEEIKLSRKEDMLKLLKKYRYLLTAIIVIVLVFGSIIIRIKLEEESLLVKDEDIIVEDVKDDYKNESEEETNEEINKVFVDIKGAVINPGVYEIDSDKRVIDVVNMSGGLSDDADTSLINMAKKVEDAMVIIIYTVNEVKQASTHNSVSKIIDNTCICPNIKNDACLDNENNDSQNDEDVAVDKININTATLTELQTLPGIGESKAQNIIDYRDTNGVFSSIEEIVNVSGIGNSVYEKIKDYITV